MKSKRNKRLIIGLTFFCLAIGTYYIYSTHKHLPQSLTIEFYQNNTSSGASRIYEGTLVFQKNILVSGIETYDRGSSGGDIHEECFVKDGVWVDSKTGDLCSIYVSYMHWEKSPNGSATGSSTGSQLPLTIGELETLIKSKDILLGDRDHCEHLALCYTLK